MNPINLEVKYLDGTSAPAECIAADLIAFEQHFDLSIARLEKEVRITHLFFLAYTALRRQGKTGDDSFEQWTEKVSSVAESGSKK